jgi:hypothetical protein
MLEIFPYKLLFILHNYELTMNLSKREKASPTIFQNCNVMNVVYIGDI